MKIAAVTYLVRDYDEAIAWFVGALDFVVLEDTRLSDVKRWVRVAGRDGGTNLILAQADTPNQRAAVGQASGGRVAYFLQTLDFEESYARLRNYGVHFRESPRVETYGKVVVFEDFYGNGWDLIETVPS